MSEYLPKLIENGLDAVNISLDTLDAAKYEKITGKDKLKEVLQGISDGLDAGIPVKINSVLQKGLNDNEWSELARLTLKYPLDVRFIELMPIGYGKADEAVYNDELLEWFREKYPDIIADKSVHGNGPAVYYKIPGARGSIGFISAMHGKFCDHCNRIRLTSQGKIKPCLCFEESVDLGEILKNPEFQKVESAQKKEWLRPALEKAIRMKPENHKFENPEEITEHKKMVEIGG